MSEHSMCQALAEIQEDLSKALSREEQARIESVTEILEITNSLTNNTRASLAKEISDRQEVDNSLQTAIDAEISDRQESDNALQLVIDAEVIDRKAAIGTLDVAINKEISDRQEADTALQKTIDETINTKLNKEISDRQEVVDTLDSAVKDEASNRQKADNNLQTAINEEAIARQTASNALQTAIDDEASARQKAVATLQTAIASEASTRQEADNNLQSAIEDETTNRQEADTALQTAIASEASARQEVDSNLQAAIDAEISARQKAINDLDATEVGGKNKYISKISQTNGKISAGTGSIDTEVKKDSNNLVTSAAVWTAIDNLPEPMVFKGSLGTDGTKANLPAAASDNVGHTYKVITAGKYANKTAKIGDTFVSTGTAWELIPSGDEPSGTVTSISAGTGLTTGGNPITTSGTISLATSGATAGTYGPTSEVTGTNGTTISVPKIKVDAYGRVTSISNVTYTSKDTTYPEATTSTAGLMSNTDKKKLDSVAIRKVLDSTTTSLKPTGDSTYIVKTDNLTFTLNKCDTVGVEIVFASTKATKIKYYTPGATSTTELSMAANTVETFISTGDGYIAAKDSQMWLT